MVEAPDVGKLMVCVVCEIPQKYITENKKVKIECFIVLKLRVSNIIV